MSAATVSVRDREVWLRAIEAVNLLAPDVRDADKILAASKLIEMARLIGGKA